MSQDLRDYLAGDPPRPPSSPTLQNIPSFSPPTPHPSSSSLSLLLTSPHPTILTLYLQYLTSPVLRAFPPPPSHSPSNHLSPPVSVPLSLSLQYLMSLLPLLSPPSFTLTPHLTISLSPSPFNPPPSPMSFSLQYLTWPVLRALGQT